MKFLILACIILPLSTKAEICSEQTAFTNMEGILNYMTKDDYPKLKMTYKLAGDCSYDSITEVEIQDTNPSIDDFMLNHIISPQTIKDSSPGNIKELSREEKPDHHFNQYMSVGNKFMSAKLFSSCAISNPSKDETDSDCVYDPERSEVKMGFTRKLFERHAATIHCKISSPTIKKCIFTAVGKARDVKFMGRGKSACDMSHMGASEGFKGIYRLAYFINHGNLNSANANTIIEQASTIIDRMVDSLQQNPEVGKSSINVSETLP